MQKNRPIFYWDACIFLAWLKNERRPDGEMEGLAEVVSLITRGEVTLITSVLTRVEVLESTLSQNAQKLFEDIFKHRNIVRINMDEHVSIFAHKIRDYYKSTGNSLETPDAVHLASAITYGAEQFHTFDDKLLRLNGTVAGYPLVICQPKGVQTVLF